jgi:membrane protein YqaA with SNARE-associated domain
MAWVAVWGIAVALNVVPAFMPPTWAMLAYFHLYHALPIIPLAIIGALGATTGRALLAIASRAFGERFVPASARANIEGLVEILEERPTLAIPTLALFALGPIPSNHLFIAAGLARAPLLPILAVFCIARCISYIIWVSAANAADQSLRDLLGPQIGGWEIILIQVLGFGLIILSLRVNWRRVLGDRWPASQPERKRAVVDVEHPAPPDEAASPQSAPSPTPWSSHRE